MRIQFVDGMTDVWPIYDMEADYEFSGSVSDGVRANDCL